MSDNPITREEAYLSAIAGLSTLPSGMEPITREEWYLAQILENGGGTGGGGLTIVEMTSSDTSVTMTAGNFYMFPEMATLAVTVPASGEVAFRFTSGATATTLTVTGVTMPDDFTVEANRVYEVNVFEGYGVAVNWEYTAAVSAE